MLSWNDLVGMVQGMVVRRTKDFEMIIYRKICRQDILDGLKHELWFHKLIIDINIETRHRLKLGNCFLLNQSFNDSCHWSIVFNQQLATFQCPFLRVWIPWPISNISAIDWAGCRCHSRILWVVDLQSQRAQDQIGDVVQGHAVANLRRWNQNFGCHGSVWGDLLRCCKRWLASSYQCGQASVVAEQSPIDPCLFCDGACNQPDFK